MTFAATLVVGFCLALGLLISGIGLWALTARRETQEDPRNEPAHGDWPSVSLDFTDTAHGRSSER